MARYLTRPLGLEAVLRLRTSRGINMNGFHGHFFVRSQDLLALPCVSPDHGYTFQLTIEDELGRHNGNAFFQSALLYTSSNGQRRIRVHTLALPVVKDASKVFAHADTVAITALLAKLGGFGAGRAGSACLGGRNLRPRRRWRPGGARQALSHPFFCCGRGRALSPPPCVAAADRLPPLLPRRPVAILHPSLAQASTGWKRAACRMRAWP